ncbi:telomere recombination protein [Streptomyces sp. 840.1]|uniref:Sua5/YciO/YrdC/YwlC family protein n=1 Tax=Streptomyces sp. 840.1 TaxID=2485152 RepID=UPI000F490262|nr:Sua5/YciO/YrdC/YwlC family protein [Streptomyces sp. 840.1]ROQ63743.1 telomere recombination protein [Streptomyces sp. 840.1]
MNSDATAPRDAADMEDIRRALRGDAAVVLPNPPPLTHVVTATRPHTVNEAKARPAAQPVALWAHHPATLRTVTACTGLDPAGTALAGRLLAEEHLTLLLPLRTDTRLPAWLPPACKDGWVLLFGARWHPLVPLLDDHPVLYVSSANRTGHQPATTPAEALAMFPASVPVLHLPHPGDDPADSATRRATTTVALHPDGNLALHRTGAQDQPYPHPDDYLAHLRTQYTPSFT